jgi:hypothetical protein
MSDTLSFVAIPRAQYARMIAEHDMMTQELSELRTANANYMQDAEAQAWRIAELEAAVKRMAPVVRAIACCESTDHVLDCEAGFIDHESLNI